MVKIESINIPIPGKSDMKIKKCPEFTERQYRSVINDLDNLGIRVGQPNRSAGKCGRGNI